MLLRILPARKNRGRKCQGRNYSRKKKERGKYKPKSVGLCDVDVAECIFSDEEVGAAYMEDQQLCSTQLNLPEDAEPQREEYSDSSSTSTSGLTSPGPSESPSDVSRPSSAASSHQDNSLIDASCEVECSLEVLSDSLSSTSSSVPSRPGSRLSVSSMSAACDMHLMFGATDKEASEKDCVVSNDIVNAVVQTCKKNLPSAWIPVATHHCLRLFLLSNSKQKAIQREIVLNYNGTVSIYVHCECLLDKKVLTLNSLPSLNHVDSVPVFCENGLKIVKTVMNYDICLGANHDLTRSVWHIIPDTYIDINPYKEDSYVETCRSVSCHRLVKCEKGKAARCVSCLLVLKSLRKREASLRTETASPFTSNVHLTLPQALNKLEVQRGELRKKDKKIARLEKAVEDLLTQEGVDIEEDCSSDFSDILKNAKLTPIQKLFLEQQLKATNATNPRCRRWHPTLIRLALHLKMTSASTYEALRDSGAVILPSSRTLYDYSHAIAPEEGISNGILKRLHDNVQKKTKEFQKYCSLLCDEMYVSRNLVHRVSDNSLIGYQNLDEVEKELANFEAFVEGQFSGKSTKFEAPLAKTMLAFMVKGLCTDVKIVVAAFPMTSVTADNIYVRAWQVISRLEKAGIKIIAFVCDGAAPNRTFVGMHTPLTDTKSEIIFDTRNFCSPEGRPLFFIFDVCHLLKTVRNCFYNSGDEDKKPRCMEYSGEKILWKHIVRLYMENKNSNFRKSYKLNAQNVFPNAFSCMKVKYAAEVLSNTVANDLEFKKWPHTAETIRFIRYHNKFFDCLNGAYRDQGKRTRNENLEPYTEVNDKRFSWLGVPNSGHENDHGEEITYLDYIREWKNQVKNMPISAKLKEKKKLSWQVMHGTETTIRAFAGAVRFMFQLQEPPQFILGRGFSQDPLEQHFSLQRSGCGGSRNPNVNQFLGKQVSLAIQQDLGVKKRKANVEATHEGIKITEEALPKRPRSSKKKD